MPRHSRLLAGSRPVSFPQDFLVMLKYKTIKAGSKTGNEILHPKVPYDVPASPRTGGYEYVWALPHLGARRARYDAALDREAVNVA